MFLGSGGNTVKNAILILLKLLVAKLEGPTGLQQPFIQMPTLQSRRQYRPRAIRRPRSSIFKAVEVSAIPDEESEISHIHLRGEDQASYRWLQNRGIYFNANTTEYFWSGTAFSRHGGGGRAGIIVFVI